ncbi:MAG: hypothetical protein IPH58_04030 [Sphingobacteriales bacterium]|nr:hypothetical protein [Sphingobacteriales bacterium]
MTTKSVTNRRLLSSKANRKPSESQQYTIESQQLEILQLKRYIFGSRHERFTAAGLPTGMPTLFDIPAIAEQIIESTSTVSYQKKSTRLQPNHKGRNGFLSRCAEKSKYAIRKA